MNKKRIDTKEIEEARLHFSEIRVKLFSFNGHPLAKENVYKKEIYIALLCSISAYDGEISEKENELIKKIINGINLKTSYSQLLKLGVEIEPKTIDDFFENFSQKPLAFNFLFDALLLASCDGFIHDKEIELIAEISELLRIFPKDVEFIAKLVSSFTAYNKVLTKSLLSQSKYSNNFKYLLTQLESYPERKKTSKKKSNNQKEQKKSDDLWAQLEESYRKLEKTLDEI